MFYPRPGRLGFVINKVALRQINLQEPRFPAVSIILPMPHTQTFIQLVIPGFLSKKVKAFPLQASGAQRVLGG
jgi:hypothetical protein